MMSTAIPVKLLKYIPLSTFFNDFGCHIYGTQWDQTEQTIGEIPTFEEACLLKEEEADTTAKVIKRFRKADDKFLEYVEFMTNEVDDLKDIYRDKKEYAYRVAVSQLRAIRYKISTIPSIEDKQFYDSRYNAWLRRVDIESKIVELLANEGVVAYCRTENGREIISKHLWASTNIKFVLNNSQVTIQKKIFNNVEFYVVQAKEILSCFPSAGTDLFQNKGEAEKAAYCELLQVMRNPDNMYPTKVEWEPIFIQKFFPHLSKNAFKRSWEKASNETGSGLSKAGRRPSKPKS